MKNNIKQNISINIIKNKERYNICFYIFDENNS